MTRFAMVATLAVLTVAAPALSAHDDYRVIGTVTKVTAKTLAVKQTKDGKIVSMKIDSGTIVTRDKKTVDRALLKAGLSVVVDARGDSMEDLAVLEVRLVPGPTDKK